MSFPFWFTDIVSETPSVRAALARVRKLQRADGTFALRMMKGKDPDLPWWICLAICRSLARWEGSP